MPLTRATLGGRTALLLLLLYLLVITTPLAKAYNASCPVVAWKKLPDNCLTFEGMTQNQCDTLEKRWLDPDAYKCNKCARRTYWLGPGCPTRCAKFAEDKRECKRRLRNTLPSKPGKFCRVVVDTDLADDDEEEDEGDITTVKECVDLVKELQATANTSLSDACGNPRKFCDVLSMDPTWEDGGCKIYSDCNIHCRDVCLKQPNCRWRSGKCLTKKHI